MARNRLGHADLSMPPEQPSRTLLSGMSPTSILPYEIMLIIAGMLPKYALRISLAYVSKDFSTIRTNALYREVYITWQSYSVDENSSGCCTLYTLHHALLHSWGSLGSWITRFGVMVIDHDITFEPTNIHHQVF